MLETAEIRWFFKGQVPKEISEWFKGYHNFPVSTQTRTDHYLRLPCDAIGIKIREGMIEHKQKGDGVGELWSDGVCSGKVEYWQKWSYPLDDDHAIADMLKTYPGSWLGITKERALRLLDFDGNGEIRSTTFENMSGAAVGWELTTLQIEGSDDSWWTTGFEAFGSDNELKETLVNVYNIILPDCPLALVTEDCYSYPTWLRKISEF